MIVFFLISCSFNRIIQETSQLSGWMNTFSIANETFFPVLYQKMH